MAELAQVLALMKYNGKYSQTVKIDHQIKQSSRRLVTVDSNNNKCHELSTKYGLESKQSRWRNLKQNVKWCGNNTASEN